MLQLNHNQMTNNQVYDKNLVALKKRYSDLAEHIEKLDTEHYQIVPSSSGMPYLQVTRAVSEEIVCIHDQNDPLAGEQAFIPLDKEDKNLFLVMGQGLGYLLFQAAKIYPKSKFLILESDARIFKKALQCFDFVPYLESSRFEFMVAYQAKYLPFHFGNYFIKDNNYVYQPKMELLSNPQTVKLTYKYYDEAAKIFNQSCQDLWNKMIGNSYEDTLLSLQQTLKNLPLLTQRVAALEDFKDCFQDKIGVVVSSGPSLNNKLDELKRIQDKAVIICADSALRVLLANGIQPFGVSSLERTPEISTLYEGYSIPEDIILFAPLLLHPKTFQNFPGPICTYFRNVFPYKWMPELMEHFNVGLCCAHQAFEVLRWFGCREIALIGQDLAYERDSGVAYYDGVAEYAEDAMQEQSFVEHEDNQGGKIKTNPYWVLYSNLYSQMILQKKFSQPVYNVIEKENGIKIKMTERIDPEDYFSRFANEDTIASFDINLSHSIEKRKADYPVYKEKLVKLIEISWQEIAQIKEDLEKITETHNFEDFIQLRDQWMSKLSEGSAYLVREILKPDLMRFEAHAFALWSEDEYEENKVKFSKHFIKIIDELLLTFQEGKDSLAL